MTKEEARKFIREQDMIARMAQQNITDLGAEMVPGFHWLDHKVSTFWTCDDSPIGMCVFYYMDNGRLDDYRGCMFCGDPVERK